MAMRTQIHRAVSRTLPHTNSTNEKHTKKNYFFFVAGIVVNLLCTVHTQVVAIRSSNMRAKIFHEHTILHFRRELSAGLRCRRHCHRLEPKQTDINMKKQMKMQWQKEVGDLDLNKSNCLEAIHIGSVFPSSAAFLSHLSPAATAALHPHQLRHHILQK